MPPQANEDAYEEETEGAAPRGKVFHALIRRGFVFHVAGPKGLRTIRGNGTARVPVDKETALANWARLDETDKLRKFFNLPPIPDRSNPIDTPGGRRRGGMSEADVRSIVRDTVRGEVSNLEGVVAKLADAVGKLAAGKSSEPAARKPKRRGR
jgi:hypothetical protein